MLVSEHRVILGTSVHRVKDDVNGNSRYVVHYTEIPFRERGKNETYTDYQNAWIDHSKDALGGNIYRGREFGGGIVFYSANLEQTLVDAYQKFHNSRHKVIDALGRATDVSPNVQDDPEVTRLIIERNLWDYKPYEDKIYRD